MPVQLPVRLYPERLDPVSDAGAALPRRVDAPGTTLELLVVAADRDCCAGVDLVSGALVRAWSPWPLDPTVQPFDVVSVTLDDDQTEVGPGAWIHMTAGLRHSIRTRTPVVMLLLLLK